MKTASEKFAASRYKCGDIKDFHAGLTARVGKTILPFAAFELPSKNQNEIQQTDFHFIGNPHLDFFRAMQLEHCTKGGNDLIIETTNYRLKTTPKQEWQILVDGAEVKPADMRHNRVVKSVSAYMELDAVRLAKLSKPEVIAVVLYTSPMVRTPLDQNIEFQIKIFKCVATQS